MKRTALAVGVCVAIALVTLGAHPSHAERPNGGRIQQQKTTTTEAPADASAGFLRAQAYVEVTTYLAARAEEERTLEALGAVGAFLATLVPPPPARAPMPTPTYTPPSGGGGSCYDSAVPAYIVTRESGGDPYIVNGGGHAPSPYLSGGRAWGCFQFMPGTWASSCAGFSFDVSGQVACANKVWAGGAGAGNWGA